MMGTRWIVLWPPISLEKVHMHPAQARLFATFKVVTDEKEPASYRLDAEVPSQGSREA